MRQATVNKVLTYSVVDGPGNRLVLFMQGCNFACKTCHNPYTIDPCTHCGACIPACYSDALQMVDGKVVFDETRCDQCDNCLKACPISSSPMVSMLTVADVVEITRQYLPFINGLTVSGGEVTVQLKFVIELFEALKSAPDLAHLSRFIDTNGHLGKDGWARLLPVTDGVMLDIKALDPDKHRFLTGQHNRKVLQSARLLHEAGKLHELRYLVIPGHTDTKAEVDALIALILRLDPNLPIRLNAFQHHGVRGAATSWPKATKPVIETIKSRLFQADIPNVITPALYL